MKKASRSTTTTNNITPASATTIKCARTWNAGVKFNGNWSKMVYALEDGFTDDNSTNTAGFDMQYAIAGITPYDPVAKSVLAA